MLVGFNAFQLVALFASMPFALSYLWGAHFPFAHAAFYVAAVIYFILFIIMWLCTANAFDKQGSWI